MARELWVMITAMVIAMLVMLIFAKRIANFIESNPTLKMLALSFLILIGVMLVAESMGTHFNKGYIYFAMAFSLGVEFLNLRLHNKKKRKLADVAS
jgi:predicted tellurium resistance membrane protein TerC